MRITKSIVTFLTQETLVDIDTTKVIMFQYICEGFMTESLIFDSHFSMQRKFFRAFKCGRYGRQETLLGMRT